MLEDLSAAGVDGDNSDWVGPMIDMGFWPPRQGPRVKGFETAKPKLVCVPFIGDLQTMTYRTNVYAQAPKTWEEMISVGQQGVKAGKIKSAVVFRGVAGNSIMNSWFPIFRSWGGVFFDDKWKPTFNSPAGKDSAEFFVGTMKKNAPEGVVEYDFRPGRRSDPRRRRRRHRPVFRQRREGERSGPVEGAGQARPSPPCRRRRTPSPRWASSSPAFRSRPPTRPTPSRFLKWYTSPEIQMKVAESGMIPVPVPGSPRPSLAML